MTPRCLLNPWRFRLVLLLDAEAPEGAALWAYVSASPFASVLRLRVFGMQPFCGDAGIGSPVSNRELVPVTITALNTELRDRLTAPASRSVSMMTPVRIRLRSKRRMS